MRLILFWRSALLVLVLAVLVGADLYATHALRQQGQDFSFHNPDAAARAAETDALVATFQRRFWVAGAGVLLLAGAVLLAVSRSFDVRIRQLDNFRGGWPREIFVRWRWSWAAAGWTSWGTR